MEKVWWLHGGHEAERMEKEGSGFQNLLEGHTLNNLIPFMEPQHPKVPPSPMSAPSG